MLRLLAATGGMKPLRRPEFVYARACARQNTITSKLGKNRVPFSLGWVSPENVHDGEALAGRSRLPNSLRRGTFLWDTNKNKKKRIRFARGYCQQLLIYHATSVVNGVRGRYACKGWAKTVSTNLRSAYRPPLACNTTPTACLVCCNTRPQTYMHEK